MGQESSDRGEQLCCFCRELATGKLPSEFTEKSGIVNRVISQSDTFVAVPSISPITAGHVLIVPKQHVTSLRQLQRNVVTELDTFGNVLIELLTRHFGRPILFEHGIGKGKVGGCGVNHAHLHILPTKPDVARKVQSIIFHQFRFSGATSLIEFLSHDDTGDSYLLFGRDMKKIFYSYEENIPSQYFRKLIAKEMGNSSWDWKNMSAWSDFINTHETLSNPHTIKQVSK